MVGLRAKARQEKADEGLFGSFATGSVAPGTVAKLEEKVAAQQARFRHDGTTTAVKGYERAKTDLQKKGYWPAEHGSVLILGGGTSVSAGSGASGTRSPKSLCASGPEVIAPLVQGEQEAVAARRLRRYGFTVSIERQPNGSVPLGFVSEELPLPPVCPETTMTLVVSTGKLAPRTSANGYSVAEVRATFARSGVALAEQRGQSKNKGDCPHWLQSKNPQDWVVVLLCGSAGPPDWIRTEINTLASPFPGASGGAGLVVHESSRGNVYVFSLAPKSESQRQLADVKYALALLKAMRSRAASSSAQAAVPPRQMVIINIGSPCYSGKMVSVSSVRRVFAAAGAPLLIDRPATAQDHLAFLRLRQPLPKNDYLWI